MQVHIGSPKTRITQGVVKETSWSRLMPALREIFNVKDDEVIAELQPTHNGIRIKIEKV